MQKIFPVIFLIISFGLANAQEENDIIPNNISVNLLAIPLKTGVITYEKYFRKQSIWLGLEHYFNGLDPDNNRNTNSIALEYRRYFQKKSEKANGPFGGVYFKTSWGRETLPDNHSDYHEYIVLFSGLNAGYKYYYKRLVVSAFVGYGLPIAISEKSSPKGNPNFLNDGYKQDLRLGLTVGWAF